MKQVFQHLNSGFTELGEVPCPQLKPGCLLIQSRASMVSTGTERMLVEFGKANLLEKARQQPEKVKQVLEKMKTDGLWATTEAVLAKLDKPLPLGYSNAGILLQVGGGVEGYKAGDRVVSNGPHAEIVCVPKHLCAKIPDLVEDEAAAFTVLGAISLQGVRLIQPALAERIAVCGLGLIGLLAVQILRAHGCKVLGIDYNQDKLSLAKSFGAETVNLGAGEDPVAAGIHFSDGCGVDGVLIAAATSSSDPVHQAAQMCRKRGRIVLVGVTGLELSRNDFYEKELTFQVSCSYGPGRYDPNYEEKGMDYPFGFVRWTEQRNLEAVLEMMADGRLQTKPLITNRFQFVQAVDAYRFLYESKSPLGILLQYPVAQSMSERPINNPAIALKTVANFKTAAAGEPVLGMIGAGEFATRFLLPALKKSNIRMKAITSLGGLNGMYAGRKFGFQLAVTDADSVMSDPEVNLVFIATRHDSHADLVCRALQSGKHVFVEKPLALNREELDRITNVYRAAHQSAAMVPKLMVGFNRRFSPHIDKMRLLLQTIKGPKAMIMTVNAGAVPARHWVHDPQAGGGRIIGEGCHFIDLLRFLAGSSIERIAAVSLESGQACSDTLSFTLHFTDGSIGTVHYFTNGHQSYPKERLEVFGGGRILRLDNFKTLTGYGWPHFKHFRLPRQDKGHMAEVMAFIQSVKSGGPPPIPIAELIEVTEASFQIAESLRQ
jgi:predicted dehydrogenase/threonine dehydrogenase-like Zn-dependent dehydrogenase